MSNLAKFLKAVDELAVQYRVDHVFIYAAGVTGSAEHRRGLPPEAAHGILQALTALYADRADQITRERYLAANAQKTEVQ